MLLRFDDPICCLIVALIRVSRTFHCLGEHSTADQLQMRLIYYIDVLTIRVLMEIIHTTVTYRVL